MNNKNKFNPNLNDSDRVNAAYVASLNRRSGADSHYTHNQILASSTWVVVHNLNKNPAIDIVDASGSVVYGDIVHNSMMQATITFSAPFSGKAYIN
jgi:hypothetical protein